MVLIDPNSLGLLVASPPACPDPSPLCSRPMIEIADECSVAYAVVIEQMSEMGGEQDCPALAERGKLIRGRWLANIEEGDCVD